MLFSLDSVPCWEFCHLSFVFQILKCQYWVWLNWLILWLSDSCMIWSSMWLTVTVQVCREKICFWRHLDQGYNVCFFRVFCRSFSHLLTSPAPCLGGLCWKSPFSRMCCSWQPIPNHHLAKRWWSDWRNKYSGRFLLLCSLLHIHPDLWLLKGAIRVKDIFAWWMIKALPRRLLGADDVNVSVPRFRFFSTREA